MRRPLLDRLNQERAARQPAALITRLSDGAQALVTADRATDDGLAVDAALMAAAEEALATDRSGVLDEDPDLFVQAFNPPLRLIVVGAVHIAQSLVPMARLAGYEVVLIDPRRAWATPERFPEVTVIGDWPDRAMERVAPDRRTAVVALSHDPKIDDPALTVALKSEAFYIGALGSRRSHAKRLERLREAGIEDKDSARIHGPVGLDLGGRSPAEISVAILAQITRERHSHPARHVAAVVLAAGRSSRMGGANKLLEALDGKPIVRRVVESALASRAHPVIVVTGHQAGEIETALAGCPATLVNNEDFAEGLSASLRRGLAALPAGVQGAVVCLGDMPRVSYRVINRLIDAFDPRFGRSIVVPTHRGRRGNPVLLGRQHFAEISALTGDVGAKPLVSRRSDETAEVAVAEEGVLIDVDTPEALDTVKAGG